MNVERPILWHQGLFLQPQHLQLADRYHESMLSPILRYGFPYFWGLIGLTVHEAGLDHKSFEVLQGEFIFQDGAHAVFPGNAVIRSRSFDDAWVASDKPFTVYLGLRKWNPAGENVAVVPSLSAPSEQSVRFLTAADPETVNDLHAGGPAGQVKRMQFAPRIFWETELGQLDDYQVMPIAQLERDGELIRLSRRYIPPSPYAASSDRLMQSLKDIRDQVISRCRQLEEYKSPKEVQTMAFDIGYVVFLLALRSLNRNVPMMNHLMETPYVHPWQLYGTLRQLIGELSTFSENLSATGEHRDGTMALPAYDHVNLWACFSAAQRLVAELLEGITVGPGQLIRLIHDGRYYSAEISERMLDPQNRFWLVLKTRAGAERVTQDVRQVVKLSAKKDITTLLARALPGVPLEYYPVPPPGLPRRANACYFRIDQASREWTQIESARSAAMYWDTAPEDLEAEILVIRS